MRLRPLAGVVLVAVLATAPQRAFAWLTVLSGASGGNDVPEAAALLPGGDVVITGAVQSGATHEDLLAARLDGLTGRPLWRVVVNGESAGDHPDFALDSGWDVAVDRRGDVFVGGTIQTPDGGPDAAVLLLDGRTGRERWRALMRVAGAEYFDLVHDVFAHPSGDVMAVVLTTDEKGTHFFAVCLDGRSGTERWRRALPFASHQSNWSALDPSGNLVVAGLDYDYEAEQPVASIIEVSADAGAVSWTHEVRGFVPATVVVGIDGEVFLGGGQVRAAGGFDGLVLCLDGAAGAETWRTTPEGRDATVERLAVTRDGAVVLAGTVDDRRWPYLARHDGRSGVPLWRSILDSLPVSSAAVSGLAVTTSGDFIATIAGPDANRVVRLDGDSGAERWRYDVDDLSTALIGTTPRGDVVSAGTTAWNETSGLDIAVLALDGRTGRDLGRGGQGGRSRRSLPLFKPVGLRAPMCEI